MYVSFISRKLKCMKQIGELKDQIEHKYKLTELKD